MRAYTSLRQQTSSLFAVDYPWRVSLDASIGLILTSLVPAAFWTGILAATANFLGIDFSSAALLAAGCSVAAFLAAVFLALTSRPS